MDVDHHGGDLATAAAVFGISPDQWLDLSTGINPRQYPLPALPSAAFTRLSYLRDDFLASAAKYYGSEELVAVPGTQWAIEQLPPVLIAKSGIAQVLVPLPGYSEHARRWNNYGAQVANYCAMSADAAMSDIEQALAVNPEQHLVLVNPNNPTAALLSPEQIRHLRALQADNAYLIVDEAFIDVTPAVSMLSAYDASSGIIVLRSFGKFFGLAGLRLGFVFAHSQLRASLQNLQGLWGINGPAQHIAAQALADCHWQDTARAAIAKDNRLTQALVAPLLGQTVLSSGLFNSYQLPPALAQAHHNNLAGHGILTRIIPWGDHMSLLRFGLVSALDEQGIARVRQAIATIGRANDSDKEHDKKSVM